MWALGHQKSKKEALAAHRPRITPPVRVRTTATNTASPGEKVHAIAVGLVCVRVHGIALSLSLSLAAAGMRKAEVVALRESLGRAVSHVDMLWNACGGRFILHVSLQELFRHAPADLWPPKLEKRCV